ncbi:MAG: response regulator [Nitrospira sp.]
MAKVLIIDDEASIRTLLRLVLEGEGHEITEASNGCTGLVSYQCDPADLVIVDIRMPEMNGLELILALTREFLDAKVIAISGEADANDTLSTAKLLGARHILRKPFRLKTLLSSVRYELAH